MPNDHGTDPIQQLVDASFDRGDATGWFEPLYAAAARGDATVPWDRHAPHQVLVDWAASRRVAGNGAPAVVIGCGAGDDAALVSSLGFAATAFDISPSAVAAARERYPDAGIAFVVADLFTLPGDWRKAFALVVESQTVQALPLALREEATAAVASLVAPGGMLVVHAAVASEGAPRTSGPPWPLTRAEIDRFAAHGLDPVAIAKVPHPADPALLRWLAEFHRPA